jgi:hypothetical protein
VKDRQGRGRDGNWLRDARKARGFTSAELARLAVNRATGSTISKSVYAQYESGSRPIADHHRPALVSYWGELPDPEPEQPAMSPDTVAIVAAIDRLAEAVSLMAGEQTALVRGLVSGLAELVGTPGAGRAARPHAASPR